MEVSDFKAQPFSREITSGDCIWSAPSNIALVKYWGKKPGQLPANASLSFTLSACKTETKMAFVPKEKPGLSFDFLFEDAPRPDFHPKISQFLQRSLPFMPWLENFHFSINSRNTFPHSSGIASSASAMAALAANLVSIEKHFTGQMSEEAFAKKTSFIARLGSGSACRSVESSVVVWGAHHKVPGSSDLFGVPFKGKLHPNFTNYQDTILLIDRGEKQVSSTLGHELMHGHRFSMGRFDQAKDNLTALCDILASGDLEAFCRLCEREALSLHAMMMLSDPYFMLMRPGTLSVIERVWQFRRETKIPLCFTLDAGANVHLLYPEASAQKVLLFIKSELVPFCQNGAYLCDALGQGVKMLKTIE